jgi:ABC-type transport system substrate-binding protein
MRSAFLLASLSLLCACGGGGSTTALSTTPPATTCPIPVAKTSPSWKTDLYPAIQSSCGSAAQSCHLGPSPTGHVIYSGTPDEVYAQLVGVVPANAPPGYFRVAAGDLAHSWIYVKVTSDQPGGTGYGARMPYAAPDLCQPTVDTLSAWISAGAQNN